MEEWDDNWSPGASTSRLYQYDASGRVTRVQLAPQLFRTAWVRAELRYEYKSLGRRTRAYALEPRWVSGALSFATREIAGYACDLPYHGSADYTYTAGKLSTLTSPLTTIALGYDQNGAATRRDQWFTGLAGTFSVTGSVADDGRLLSSTFGSGFSKTVTWTGGYDSAGRPAQVAIGSTALWEAVLQPLNLGGAYDALDRIPLVRSNAGKVNTARSYSAYTGQLTAHAVATTAAQVYQVDSRSVAANGPAFEVMVYEHQGRLTSRRPPGGSETEGFAYDVEDHLKQVRRSEAVAEVLEYDPTGAVMFRKVGTKAFWYVGPFGTVTADVAPWC